MAERKKARPIKKPYVETPELRGVVKNDGTLLRFFYVNRPIPKKKQICSECKIVVCSCTKAPDVTYLINTLAQRLLFGDNLDQN